MNSVLVVLGSIFAAAAQDISYGYRRNYKSSQARSALKGILHTIKFDEKERSKTGITSLLIGGQIIGPL
jgi:hypothetical protein